MVKYHINDDGEPGICEASVNPCRFGSDAAHYDSEAAARKAYEASSDTFGSILLMNKRREIARKDFQRRNPIQSDGLTDNMRRFRDDIREIAEITQNYKKYRRTGLNEEFAMPKTPSHLSPYIDEDVIQSAWHHEDFREAMEMYTDAIKSYYMDSVFNSDDVDVMISDDEIAEVADYTRY